MPADVEGFSIVALHEAYDATLLDRFYNEILFPCFGIIPDEIEDLPDLHYQLKHGNSDVSGRYLLHMLLVVREDDQSILAGVCFEYYPASNCGLITYIATHPSINTRGLGLGRLLAAQAVDRLHTRAAEHGHKACQGIFFESNTDAVHDDVMVPATRRAMLRQWGVCYLDMVYVQPRLADHKAPCRTLCLGVWSNAIVTTPSGDKAILAAVVLAHLIEFYTVLMGADAVTTDADAIRQIAFLEARDYVYVWEG
ncbi:Aste57867_17205 [Aphanomyces stellatus]|uniref:Aste57867_17205 protein n=1 Tax=Aphanomyces stellatus TaxID=120398 RepID=A0A485L8X4_9STRA|nr:hypothetical protein As57867_017146 [Aphanomyces stellatus]VFT93962.1 Aste57867_17205 [Aphanomyces stellatus]